MEIKTLTSVARIGNSIYVLIPRKIANDMQLKQRDKIYIEYESDVVKLKK